MSHFHEEEFRLVRLVGNLVRLILGHVIFFFHLTKVMKFIA